MSLNVVSTWTMTSRLPRASLHPLIMETTSLGTCKVWTKLQNSEKLTLNCPNILTCSKSKLTNKKEKFPESAPTVWKSQSSKSKNSWKNKRKERKCKNRRDFSTKTLSFWPIRVLDRGITILTMRSLRRGKARWTGNFGWTSIRRWIRLNWRGTQ